MRRLFHRKLIYQSLSKQKSKKKVRLMKTLGFKLSRIIKNM